MMNYRTLKQLVNKYDFWTQDMFSERFSVKADCKIFLTCVTTGMEPRILELTV